MIPKLVNKEILCDKCKEGNHYEYCQRTVEIDVRTLKLKKDESLANLAHFRTGMYKYVFRCTCVCIQDPLYQVAQYNQVFGKLL